MLMQAELKLAWNEVITPLACHSLCPQTPAPFHCHCSLAPSSYWCFKFNDAFTPLYIHSLKLQSFTGTIFSDLRTAFLHCFCPSLLLLPWLILHILHQEGWSEHFHFITYHSRCSYIPKIITYCYKWADGVIIKQHLLSDFDRHL